MPFFYLVVLAVLVLPPLWRHVASRRRGSLD